jgi:hypothetical protein
LVSISVGLWKVKKIILEVMNPVICIKEIIQGGKSLNISETPVFRILR